jgi:RecA/RadA recombinase
VDTISAPAVVSTGSIALDVATGIGGLPRGRITEIFGPESSGKTTLALHVIAQAQKLGTFPKYFDGAKKKKKKKKSRRREKNRIRYHVYYEY